MIPIRVFDPSGKVKGWLDAGQPVHVWRNADLSSANVGSYVFTKANEGDTMESLLRLTKAEWTFTDTPAPCVKAKSMRPWMASQPSYAGCLRPRNGMTHTADF